MVNNFQKTANEGAPATAARPSAAGRVLLLVFETALMLAVALFCVSLVILRGPSAQAKERCAAALRAHSVTAPLVSLLYDAPAAPAAESAPDAKAAETAAAREEAERIAVPAAEDENGVRVEPVFGRGYSGYMLIVPDPAQVIVGCVPSSLGVRGLTVGDFAERFGAVAAINAGGFLDEGGQGNGASPDSLVVYEGEFYSAGRGVGKGFVGLDRESRLHVGLKSIDEIRDADIRYGVCFGPVLIADGVMTDPEALKSEVNPRSAIGQRADGTILLLVIDGRQVLSLGATIADMAGIMQRYGAENACNLDGGTSSLLWYDGEYLNNRTLLFRPRPVPDVFLVMPKEGS